MKLANDDRSWKWRFQRELCQWDTYGFHPKFMDFLPYNKRNWNDVNLQIIPMLPDNENPTCDEIPETKPLLVNASMTWKQWYLQQYLHNSKLYHSPESALRKIMEKKRTERTNRSGSSMNVLSVSLRFPLSQNSRNNSRGGQIFRIPIFGQAMESAASGLLYNLMWSQESPLLVTGLYPGTDGIGSGIGFKVNSKRLNLAAIYGENPLDIPQWKRFFEEADAIIYVVDAYISNEDLENAKKEIDLALKTNTHSPIMIFCCDDPNGIVDPLLEKRSPFQMATFFNMKEQHLRKWCTKSVKSVADICRGLDWLSSVL